MFVTDSDKPYETKTNFPSKNISNISYANAVQIHKYIHWNGHIFFMWQRLKKFLYAVVMWK